MISWKQIRSESYEFSGAYSETRKDLADQVITIAQTMPIGWNYNTTKKQYKEHCKQYLRNNYDRRYKGKNDAKGFIPGFIFTILLNWVINWVVNKIIENIWGKS